MERTLKRQKADAIAAAAANTKPIAFIMTMPSTALSIVLSKPTSVLLLGSYDTRESPGCDSALRFRRICRLESQVNIARAKNKSDNTDQKRGEP